MSSQKFDTLLQAALKATNASEAEKCFNALVACLLNKNKLTPIDQIENNIRDNISYLASHCSHELRMKVEALYSCEHPWFGKASKDHPITATEAYKLGLERGVKFLEELELKNEQERSPK
jgi:hypothetical protein